MYKIIALVSLIIRQYYLPNPFESLGVYGLLINLIMGGYLLHIVTYKVVGIYYDKYSFPALGSFLYLIFYCIHIYVLSLILSNYTNYIWVAVIVWGYIGLHISINWLKNNVRSLL